MKVSVLVSAYNYSGFLPCALDSVLEQTYPGPIQCIVVDDGSTDDTPRVLERYRDRVTVVRQENLGQAAAFNTAYRASTGDVLCFLDADDAWYPHKVGRVVREFLERPEVGLVHHALDVVGAKGEALERGGGKPKADGDVRGVMREKVLRWMFAPSSGLCLHRSAASYVFPLRTALRISADELVAPVAALFSETRYVEEALGVYRIHGANLFACDRREQDSRAWAERYMAVFEEKVAQANEAGARAGAAPRLSPWMKWDYIKARSTFYGTSPFRYISRSMLALARVRGLNLRKRASIGCAIVRKSLRHERRRRRAGKTAGG